MEKFRKSVADNLKRIRVESDQKYAMVKKYSILSSIDKGAYSVQGIRTNDVVMSDLINYYEVKGIKREDIKWEKLHPEVIIELNRREHERSNPPEQTALKFSIKLKGSFFSRKETTLVKKESEQDGGTATRKYSYVYLFVGMDMNTGKEFYKFGRTERPIHKRVAEHGYYNKYLLICDVTNCKNAEYDILKLLRSNDKIILIVMIIV